MIGRKVGVIPNNESPPSSTEETAQAAEPNTGQGGQTGPQAVGAGHGNQPLDNQTRSENDLGQLQPGAQPEGELADRRTNHRNEDIERAGVV